jgi:hypothetical protein
LGKSETLCEENIKSKKGSGVWFKC